MNTKELAKTIEHYAPARSAWDRGVNAYAYELLETLTERYSDEYDLSAIARNELLATMLNGASNWDQYSYDGNSFIYNEDIAKTLCTPSELKRKRNGELPPNSKESWLDVQARALHQAAIRVLRYYN